MSRARIALGGAAAVLAVSLLAALWQVPRIERDLTARSLRALDERGIAGVDVVFHGRDAVISGARASGDVAAIVGQIRGVRQVLVTGAAASSGLGTGLPATSGAPQGSETGVASQVARQIVELLGPEGLRFAPDSAELTPAERQALDRIAALLVANPAVRLQVAGYSDSTAPGSGSVLALSRLRASSVAGYLAAQGVAVGRMAVEGYGDSRPVAGNDTEAGRAANRRVEITVLGG